MDTPDVKYWRHVFRAAAVLASKVLSTCADCFCVLAKLAAYFVTGLHARSHIAFARMALAGSCTEPIVGALFLN